MRKSCYLKYGIFNNIIFIRKKRSNDFKAGHYESTIICIEGMHRTNSNTFEITDVDKEIEKLPSTNKVYQKIIKILIKERTLFKVKKGIYISVF